MWMLKIIFLFSAGLVYSTSASAITNFKCARYCKEDPESSAYKPNKVYKYQYTGSAKSLVNTTSHHVVDQTGVNIDCLVTIQSLSNCDYIMELQEVKITDHHIKSSTKTTSNADKYAPITQKLEENPLFFAFNGKIDTICPDSSESKEIIDIKRGILSVFQNSNPSFKENALVYETDITGNCETHYRVTTAQDGVKMVNKTKNLDACDHRMLNYFSWQTVPYTTSSASKSMPLLKSTLNCLLKYGRANGDDADKGIDHTGSGQGADILLESICFEKHIFQPFSNGDNGALTSIQQELKFLEINEALKQHQAPKEVKRGSLIYEYKDDKMAANDATVAVAILKELEDKTADGVDMDVPGVFSRLVYEFQRLSKTNLLEIFKQINPKQSIFFIDAISLITTNSGIEVMSELYANKKLNEKQMNSWLISINFIKNPNKQTVKLIHPLTFDAKIRNKALLSLSSVLYKYCSKQNCMDDVVILEIVKSIEKPISNNCLITSENDKKEIFLTLKSIGNAGFTSSYYNLQNCYLNNELPIELRLAAIAAHRRMKCSENENLDDFKKLLANPRANSEIRIASYLAVMQCASYATFAQIKDVLLSEEANQVGSFIWTHLTNLQETSQPWKQGIRKLLENEFLQNKFNTDIRKYSRNYEASTFVDSLGAGGGVEGNVIFTSESYLPRSAMLNFTLDLFGETINVLELGARAEGFEDIVENLFSSETSSNPNTINENSYQEKNSKQEMIDEFGEVFKVLPKQPAGSGYIKVFGNEITYTDFTSLKDIFGISITGKRALDMLIQFIKAPDIDYTKSFQLLESNYKIPTLLGFPLQLKTNATATIGLTAGGEVNVQDIRNHKMLVKGRIYPSISVQVASTMAMDTYLGETGIQYLGALKSNMFIDGYLNLEMGHVVDIKVNVPKKQMDIFTVTSDVYIIHNDDSYKIQDVTNQIDNSEYCSDQYIGKLIGLQFCNQWRFVNSSSSLQAPNFPLTGSFKYSMHIKKTDTFDFFKLYVETKLTDPNKQYLIDFVLDTPNSKIDRKLQCTLAADLKAYKISAQIHSPFANFQLQSSVEQELPKYKFQLLTTFNDKEVVTLLSTFDVKDEGETVTYEPLAKINYKQQQIVALTGKLSRIKSGEYTADLKLQGITNEVAQIYGSFTCGADSLAIKTNIMSTHFKGNLVAGLSVRTNAVSINADLKYNYNNLIQESFVINGIFNKTLNEVQNKNLFVLDMHSTEWPKYNAHVHWENKRGHLYFNNTAEVMFFETTWRAHQIVKLDKGIEDEEPDILLLADLQSPENKIDYQAKVQFNMSKIHLKTHLLFQLNQIQRIEALVNYTSIKSDDTLTILLYYDKKTWTLNGVLNKQLNRNYNFDVNCRYLALEQEHIILTLRGDYKNTSLGEMQTHRLNCTLDLPETNGEWRTPWIISSTVQKSHTTFLSQSKLSTKEADYAGHFNWIEDSLALAIQANDKQLFVLNGARTEELVSIILALNIHQHFELSTQLRMPYERFDLQVYWDKDRDESQRFIFFIEQNSFKGQYNMEVEYPNQKISTNILLIPTQVIMNVTWGIEVSQRIYLKIGNKYYGVGGLWFGELETPFKYLEKQQFNLKYAVWSDSFDVQSDLSWRTHNINLIIAGSKSDTHLNGNLQLNTTLPEIRKVGAALSHTHYIYQFIQIDAPDQSDYQSNAVFDYNDHTVQAESRWQMKGDKVDSRFLIESPSNTIEPIFGWLSLNDDTKLQGDTNMNFALNWQKKNITAMYTFKSDTSTIEIITPFEGIEKTLMKYSVVTESDSVYLSMTVDVFKQNNSITLSWTNTDEATNFWLDLMSPMTGGYYVDFTHSVLLGRLNENFKIRGPEHKDLLQMKIEGDIMPLLQVNFTGSLIFLDHDARISIANSKEARTLISNTIAMWNGRTINSKLRFQFANEDEDNQIRLINWLIISNMFTPVNVSYEKTLKDCLTKIILPNDYLLINRYEHTNPYFTNSFKLQAPKLLLELDHKKSKSFLEQKLFAQLDEKKVVYASNIFSNSDKDIDIRVNGNYNFYHGNHLVHSYNVSGFIAQTPANEQLKFIINSTSTLNGMFNYERVISPQIFGNSFKSTCNFLAYCDFHTTADKQHFLWNNKLDNKKILITYNTNDDAIKAQLQSNYKNIPNGILHLTYKNGLTLKCNLNHYHFFIEADQSANNITSIFQRNGTELAKFILEFNTPRKLNSILLINTTQKFNATFNYDLSPKSLEISSSYNSATTKAEFMSKFQNSPITDRINGQIECKFNQLTYFSTIQFSGKDLDFMLKTPTDEYQGRMHHNHNHLLHTLDVELSSNKSKNFLKFARKLDNLHLSAASDYMEIPAQEIKYSWDSWRNFTGEGYYQRSDTEKHRFTLRSTSFKDWSFAYYLPNNHLLFNINVNGRFESEKDFDALIEGSWEGRRIRFDLKNYFGDYYQTTFNLITPIKEWARTSLDCSLNDQKIGIALQAKGHYLSVVASKTGDDILRIEYMGETLLEMTSSEGHVTLRTTSYLGKYRFFIQGTQTPGIYVFSILKDGENIISFMLQNYSINEIMHYKGKLMAPDIIPNNSTISVEFMANTEISKLFEFKLKKDHKHLMELSWENNRHRHGIDGSLKFHSQIDPYLNFKLKPSLVFHENEMDVNVEMRYPCQKHTECSFVLKLQPNKFICNSLSAIEILNFNIQANFETTRNQLNCDFEFNDFKDTHVGLNVSTKITEYLRFNAIANFKDQSTMTTINWDSKQLQMEVANTNNNQNYYLLAKTQILDKHILLDLHLPENAFFPNITTKGNISINQGLVTITKNKDKYETTWQSTLTEPRMEFKAHIKQNGRNFGVITFSNTQIKGPTFQSDTLLHLSYQEHKIDALMKGLLSNNSAKAVFTLFTPWEPIKKLNTGIDLEYSTEKLNLEQFLHLGNKEFNFNANVVTTRKGMIVIMTIKPWGINNSVVNQTISANLKYDIVGNNKKPTYVFDISLGDKFEQTIYQIKVNPGQTYLIEMKQDDNHIGHLKFTKNSINFKVSSLGIVQKILIDLNPSGFVFGSDIMGYKEIFFAKTGCFGLIFVEPTEKSKKLTVIYKTNGDLPSVDVEISEYQQLKDNNHDLVMIAKVLDHQIKFTTNYFEAKKLITLELAKSQQFLIISQEENDIAWKISMKTHQRDFHSLNIYKNLQRIRNHIFVPFEVNLNVKNDTPIFYLASPSCNLSLSIINQQHVHMELGEHHLRFNLVYNPRTDFLVIHFKRNDNILHFEFDQYQNLIFTLNQNDLSLSYSAKNGFFVKFKQMINNNEIKCDLKAKSIQDITFELMKNNEKSLTWKSFLDDSSITYQLITPKWKLMKIFDVAFSWVNNTDAKVFGAALKVDSEYTGPTEAGTVFEQKEFLLNIESYFKAPFLQGLESFYGKIYIPKDFRPHLEFVIPGQTYKFYYNHWDKFMEAEVICRNQHFSVLLNNTSSNNFTLHLEFPDKRLKSLFFKYTNYGLMELEFNDEWSLALKNDLSYVDIKTPIEKFKKLGYLCEKTFADHHGEFKLVIVHPNYHEPLGLAFLMNFKDANKEVDMIYSLHSPFAIEGYDFMIINVTTRQFPEGIDTQLHLMTNGLDLGGHLGVNITEEQKLIQAEAHFNEIYYIGAVNIDPEKIYLIVGNPPKSQSNILDNFPHQFWDTYVQNTHMFYIGIKEETFDLLVHTGPQPFSLRRSGNNFIKLIWDLRNANATTLGVKYIPQQTIELYLADNHLVANHENNKTAQTTNLNWNDLNLEYSSVYDFVAINNGTYNVTYIRKVQTPLGRFQLIHHTYTAPTKLIDCIEIDWDNRTQNDEIEESASLSKQKAKLIFNNEITPGTLTSSISSLMLPHPLLLHVDMSEFQSIPSKLDATFTYSNQTEKTINFSMRYNKTFLVTNDVESVYTDRVFILKHPSSKVDYELYFDAIRMDEFSNGSVTLRYKNFETNKTEIIQGSMKVDHSKFGVHTEITTGRNRFDLMAKTTTGVKRHGFLVHVEINDKDPLNLECNYNFQKDSPSVSLMAAYGTSRKYLFYAGMPHEKEITAKLGHESYGRTSLDALAIMKLNTSQLLWMKVLWKDNLYAPFHEAILDEYNDLRYVIEAMGKELIDVIHDDVGKDFIIDCGALKTQIVNYTMIDIQRSFDQLHKRDLCPQNLKNICDIIKKSNFATALKENVLFFYDIIEYIVQSSFNSVQALYKAVNLEIDNAMKDIKNIQNIKIDAKGILKRGINTARKSLKDMETVVVKLLDDFDHYVGNMKSQIEEFFDPFLSLVDDFIVYVEQRLAMLQIAVLDTMDSIQQYIYNLQEIKAMFKVYYSYINWLEELHIIKMLDPVTDLIEEILETIIEDLRRILDHYKPYLDALGDAIFGRYDRVQQLPPIVEVREHLNRIYHKTIWVWNYHNMTQVLKTCIQKFSRDVDNVLSLVEFDDLTGSATGSNEDIEYPFGYNYVFRPENRLIEISQPLPVEWEAFNKSPSFANYPLYQKIQGKSEQFVKFYKSRYDLIDMLENFVVDLYEPSIAPTTLNYAMMIGKSQYTTFNGLQYNFLSNCSYLLASDFKTRSFSLIVNYRNTSNGNIRKSYEILSNDSSFEIFAEDKITLNGKQIDLPIIHKQVTITREKQNIIAESSRGFKMICYFHYEYCTVQLSGWLFGKTAGLLGTLDNEQYTDVTTAQKTTEGVAQFLQSWQLQKNAQCSLDIAPGLNQADSDSDYVAQVCDLWFNDTKSPLNKCFDAVDPRMYTEICYNELRANPSLKVCAPAAAYVHRCRQARVAIEMPEFCVTCKDDIGYKEEIFDGKNNKTVDVVFITELDCYNETLATRTLAEVLDEKLMRKQFVGNRFATVGYGGAVLPKPHVHTHDGGIWSQRSKNVQIESRLIGANMTKSKFSGVDAIKYAANLEFRVGVPKLFVLAQCEVATDIGNSPDIYNMLGEKDITLHVLKMSPFGQRAQVLGVDLNQAVVSTQKSAKNDIPVNQIINQIDDVYSGLALSTNGTIFDLSAVRTSSDNAALWAQALARHVSASPCQKCKCVQDFNGVGKIECSRCLAPAVKQFLNEYEEGNKMQFNDNDDNQ